MFTIKEVTWLIIAIVVAAFISILPLAKDESILKLIISMAIFAIIILTNVLAKEIAANYASVNIEHKVWELHRYGIYQRSHFKKSVPMGLLFPFIVAILSYGIIKPFTILQFDAENNEEKRLQKAYGWKRKVRKTEMHELDPATVAAAGFYMVLFVAILGAILKIPDLTRLSVYYGCWNLVPFGQLDGSKLFFGSFINWALLVIIYIISLIAVVII